LNRAKNIPALSWGIILILVILSSVSIYLFNPSKKASYVIFFPGNISTRLSGEKRFLIKNRSSEEEITNFVEELILGPLSINHGRLMPKDTKINSLLLRDETLYIDFNYSFLFSSEPTILSAQEMLDAISQSVFYNFRFIKHLHITVDGHIPYSQPYYFLK
jgi:hypothetical protein